MSDSCVMKELATVLVNSLLAGLVSSMRHMRQKGKVIADQKSGVGLKYQVSNCPKTSMSMITEDRSNSCEREKVGETNRKLRLAVESYHWSEKRNCNENGCHVVTLTDW